MTRKPIIEILTSVLIALLVITSVYFLAKNVHKDNEEYKKPFCERQAGHGISYRDKELCILQEIANNLK